MKKLYLALLFSVSLPVMAGDILSAGSGTPSVTPAPAQLFTNK